MRGIGGGRGTNSGGNGNGGGGGDTGAGGRGGRGSRGGNGGGGISGGGTGGGVATVAVAAGSKLDPNEAEALIFMREEETMARDVYTTLFEKWGKQTYANIANVRPSRLT